MSLFPFGSAMSVFGRGDQRCLLGTILANPYICLCFWMQGAYYFPIFLNLCIFFWGVLDHLFQADLFYIFHKSYNSVHYDLTNP